MNNMILKMCGLCPYAMYAQAVTFDGEDWIVFHCERCDCRPAPTD